MRYELVYERLIEKRRRQVLSRGDGYCERHHYIPRCLGGTNERWNLVFLTAKEHFIAHHLLCKMNPSNGKLLNAFIAMCTKQARQLDRKVYLSARRYEALKTAYGKYRHEIFSNMSADARAKRNAAIKAGCARRTAGEKAAIKAKRMAYFASLTEDDRARIQKKREETISNRTEARKREIFETLSKSHRKLSEDDELRIVAEYQGGRTAMEISLLPWCTLGREGVNYLLRRRGIVTHLNQRWLDREEQICEDYQAHKYVTRNALSRAYGTSWTTIARILNKHGVAVSVNANRSHARMMIEDAKLRKEWVEYSTPFSRTIQSSSLYDAIERLRMWNIVPRKGSRRMILKKIRSALAGRVKFAYGYCWQSIQIH